MSNANNTGSAQRPAWCLPALACILSGGAFALVAQPSPGVAKAPGTSHCYSSVCHRVRTVEQTRHLIGRSFAVETSYYDLPGVDRFNTGAYTSNGERFDANDSGRVASADLPDGTELLLRNPINGRVSHVLVNDFGPFRGNRRLDVTRRVAEDLDFKHKGVVRLDVIVIAAPGDGDLTYRRNRERRATRGHLGVVFDQELPELVSGLVAERKPAPEGGSVVASVETTQRETAALGNEADVDAESAALAEATPGREPADAASEPPVAVVDAHPEQVSPASSTAGPTVVAEVTAEAGIATSPLASVHGDNGAQTPSRIEVAGYLGAAAAPSAFQTIPVPPLTAHRNLFFVLLAGLLSAVLATSLAASQRRPSRVLSDAPARPRKSIFTIAATRSGNDKLLTGEVANAPAVLSPAGERADVTIRLAQTAIAAPDRAVTSIAADLTIEGVLRSPGRVEIAGMVKGRIEADTLVVLPGGTVEGDAICRFVEVAGTLTGAISAQILVVRSTGHVGASIETAAISVESGARFEGHVRRRRMA